MYHVLKAGDPDGKCIYLMSGNEHKELNLKSDLAATVISVKCQNWNTDMSPWQAEGFRGEVFSGGADAFLAKLTGDIIPNTERELCLCPKKRAIAGYSLAGLFALYALTKTDYFNSAASASGSLWFDGWTEHLKRNGFCGTPEFIYLSLGDRERFTKDLRMRTVEDRTKETVEYFKNEGIDTEFILNKGGHFNNVNARIELAIEALAGKCGMNRREY